MYTLITLLWIFCVIQNVLLAQTTYKRFGKTKTIVTIYGSWIAAIAITGGMLADYFGPNQTFPFVKFIALTGPINLLIESIISFLIPKRGKKSPKLKVHFSRVIFDVVSLLASILGIVSFYLDYIAK